MAQWYIPEELPDINDYIGNDQLSSTTKMRASFLNWIVLTLLYLQPNEAFMTKDLEYVLTRDNERLYVKK